MGVIWRSSHLVHQGKRIEAVLWLSPVCSEGAVRRAHPLAVAEVGRHVASPGHASRPKALHGPMPLVLRGGSRAAHVLPLLPAWILWRGRHVARP